MPLTKQQLLIPRVLCIGGKEGEPNYPFSMFTTGVILVKNSEYVYKSTGKFEFSILSEIVDKFPHLFSQMPWWEGRKVDELPDYVKQTGMEDSAGNPVQDVVMKVKKHHSAGNGEWRDDSINIFCADSYLTGTPGSFSYAGWEPADLSDWEEYQKQKQ